MVAPGEIYECDFGTPMGHEAGFRRPAVVISPAQLNQHGICLLLPITRTRRGYPTHVELDGVLPVTCYVQCELIRAVSTTRLIARRGAIDIVTTSAIRQVLSRLIAL